MKRYTLCKCCFCVLAVLFLLIRAGALPQAEDVCGGPVTAAGTVSRIEEKENDSYQKQIILSLSSAAFCGGSFPEQNQNNPNPAKESARGILCYLARGEQAPRLGERIVVSGQAVMFRRPRNPGGFDEASYYLAKGSLFALKKAVIVTRSGSCDRYRQGLLLCRLYAAERLKEICGEDAGVMQAMLLGDKSALPEEVRRLYQKGGISHILAISGLHISFLGVGLYRLLKKMLPLIPAGMATAVFLISYVILTGGSPSAMRAGMMFLLAVLAEATGRSYHRMTALSVSALLTVLGQPLLLTQSGFLLSYGAIVGLELVSPILSRLWSGRIARLFTAGISVSAVTLPILLFSFYEFPICSFLLNLLVIPLTGLVMALGILAFLTGLVSAPLGKLIFMPVHLILCLFETCCTLVGRLPGNMWRTGKPELVQIAMYVACLLVFCLAGKYMTKPLAILLLAGGLWLLTGNVRTGERILILDVGQGDGILLQNREGSAVLVDGGSSSERDLAEYTLIPCLKSRGIRRLDYIFLTHMDADHISGVEDLLEALGTSREEVAVDTLILPDIGNPDETYERIVSLAHAAGVRVCVMGYGDRLFAGGFSILCLHPQKGESYEDRNAASLVLYLQKGAFSALLMGDLDGDAEELFAGRMRRFFGSGVTVLKAGHHGSAASCGDDFLSLTRPLLTVISCGEDNSYGHPDERTVKRLCTYGSQVFVTKDTGAVEIIVRSGSVKGKTWRMGVAFTAIRE